MVVNLAAVAFSNLHLFAAWLFQEGAPGWDPISLWKQMGILAKIVVIILFIMSGWSIGVMIDRWMAFNAARNQSRSFAPAVSTSNICRSSRTKPFPTLFTRELIRLRRV